MKLFIYFLCIQALFFDTCLFTMSRALSLKVYDDDAGFCLIEPVHQQMARMRWQLAIFAVMHTIREERSQQKYMLLDQAIKELRKCAVKRSIKAKELVSEQRLFLQQLNMQNAEKQEELVVVRKALSTKVDEEFKVKIKDLLGDEGYERRKIESTLRKELEDLCLIFEGIMCAHGVDRKQAIKLRDSNRYPVYYPAQAQKQVAPACSGSSRGVPIVNKIERSNAL